MSLKKRVQDNWMQILLLFLAVLALVMLHETRMDLPFNLMDEP